MVDIFPDYLAHLDVDVWFERYRDCRRGGGISVTRADATPNVLDLTWIPLGRPTRGGNAGFQYADARFWSKVGHVITLSWEFTYLQETAFVGYPSFSADQWESLLAVSYTVWWEYRVCDGWCYWGSESTSGCFPKVLFELCEPW